MDPRRFDSLSRDLSRARSRRGALSAVVGGTLALLGVTETTAKHKHKKKHSPPVAPPPSSPPGAPPPPPGSPPPPPTECQGLSDFTPCGAGGCMACADGVC